MRFKLLAAAVLFTAPALVLAKPLTVCTESSPDGFDVVQFNSLVTTNASADVIFNSLVSYDEAAKKVVPALADKWDVSADGLTYTFHLRPNVQFQTTDYFKPTRALNADDVVFTFDRMLNDSNPWHKVAGASGFPHAQSMGLAEAHQVDQQGRRQHRQVRTERAGRDLRADPDHGFRVDLFGRIRRPVAQGRQAGRSEREADRHRSVRC